MKSIFVFVIYGLMVGCSLSRFYKKGVREDGFSDSKRIEYNYSFTEATKQKIFGNYTQAINLLDRCRQINPQSAAVYFQISDIYSIMGEKNNALNYARIAVKLDKKNIWYKVNLAHVYQTNDKIDSTIFVYRKIVKLNPKYEYQFNYALLYAKANNYKKSIKILKKLERKYGFNKEIAVSLYKIYTFWNDNKNAIKVLKEAINSYPEESPFYGLLAEHYASIGENNLALQYYDKLLNIDPDNEKGILSLFEFYRNIPDYYKAIDLARKILRNEIFAKERKIEIINTLFNDNKFFSGFQQEIKGLCDSVISYYKDDYKFRVLRADYFIKADDLKNASKELISIIDIKKDDSVLWEKLFNVLNSLGDYETIFKLSDEAISNFKGQASFYLYKGIAAYQLKQYSVALGLFNKGFTLIHNSKTLELQFYTFLGEAYNALNDYPKSDSCFELALTIDKHNIYILNNYSYYLALRSEKMDKALEYAKRCLEIEPSNYIYLGTYGWVLFKMGNLEEAREVIKKAINTGGAQNPDILLHYVQVLIKLNLKEEAMKYYKLMKDLGRDSIEVRNLLNISD